MHNSKFQIQSFFSLRKFLFNVDVKPCSPAIGLLTRHAAELHVCIAVHWICGVSSDVFFALCFLICTLLFHNGGDSPAPKAPPRGTDIMWISKCTGSLVNTKECLPSRTCPGKQNSRITIIELRSPGFRPMLTIDGADILRVQKRSWCLPTLGIVSLL